jgi:hypothetical protein
MIAAGIIAATLLRSSWAAVRTLEQRVTAGECAAPEDGSALFPVSYLADYRSLSAASLDAIDGPIAAAELIEINYGQSFKVLTEKFATEQYVLTQCGHAAPSEADINTVKTLPAGYTRKYFTIPLQKASFESSVQLGFLHELGLHDRVAHAPSTAVGACWQKINDCNVAGVSADIEATRQNMDAAFMDCPWGSNGQDCSSLASISNAVHFSASQDPAPIHSAEHIKFMAAFFNKEEDAERVFDSEVSKLQTMKNQMAARADADKQTVAWISQSWDGKYELSTAPYKKLMTEQAGSKVVDAAAVKTTLGNTMDDNHKVAAGDVGAFMQALADNGVTALIDETYAGQGNAPPSYDFAKFLTTFGLTSTSTLPFIQNQMVMRTDSGYSGTGNLDWFESRMVFPSKAVEGLQRVLDSDTSKAKAYFRNIAKSESADAISKDSCSATLAMCSTSGLPAVLPLINKLGMASGAVHVSSMLGVTISALVALLQ